MHFSLHSMRRPRHPVARFLSLLLGLALIGVLLVFGLMVAGVLLVGGVILLAIRQWKLGHTPAPPVTSQAKGHPAVLEGEFRVLHTGRN
ncbi:MAG: hypothetical protein ABI129_08885 [Rhodanobacter sp.]